MNEFTTTRSPTLRSRTSAADLNDLADKLVPDNVTGCASSERSRRPGADQCRTNPRRHSHDRVARIQSGGSSTVSTASLFIPSQMSALTARPSLRLSLATAIESEPAASSCGGRAAAACTTAISPVSMTACPAQRDAAACIGTDGQYQSGCGRPVPYRGHPVPGAAASQSRRQEPGAARSRRSRASNRWTVTTRQRALSSRGARSPSRRLLHGTAPCRSPQPPRVWPAHVSCSHRTWRPLPRTSRDCTAGEVRVADEVAADPPVAVDIPRDFVGQNSCNGPLGASTPCDDAECCLSGGRLAGSGGAGMTPTPP